MVNVGGGDPDAAATVTVSPALEVVGRERCATEAVVFEDLGNKKPAVDYQ